MRGQRWEDKALRWEHAGSFEEYKEGLHGWSRVSEREKSWEGTEV